MGQKTNPVLFRITGRNPDFGWSSDWYQHNDKVYAANLVEDLKIMSYFDKMKAQSSVCNIGIERKSSNPHVIVRSAKSSAIIGKGGKGLEVISADLFKILKRKVTISVADAKRPEFNATIASKLIADQIQRRIHYKKAIKSVMESIVRAGAAGVKISCSGRLSGAEIARSEKFKSGSMPLHSIRANISYAVAEAKTVYGIIGIKVWIYSIPKFRK